MGENCLQYRTLEKEMSAVWGVELKIFRKSHCGHTLLTVPPLSPHTPFTQLTGEGFVRMLSSGMRVNVRQSKLSVTVPFPSSVAGLDLSMCHDWAAEGKHIAS